jgi:hypothetical protein
LLLTVIFLAGRPMTSHRYGVIATTINAGTASTTAMCVPALLATVAADLVATVLLYPLEMSVLRIHLDAGSGGDGGLLVPSVASCFALYKAAPSLAGSLVCEAITRLGLVCATSLMLQRSAATFIAMHGN